MVGIFVCAFRMSLLAYDEERYMIVNRSDEKIGDFKNGMSDERHMSTQQCASTRETLYDLLCRYKWGYIGSLRQLREVVENAIGKKYSISTLLRKVRKLDESTQKGTDSSEQVREQSLHQIRESGEGELCWRKTLSQQLRKTLITLPEKGGVRQYTCIRRTRDGSCEYYRCNNCTRWRRKTGFGRIAYIRVLEGHVISGKAAQHHPSCELIDATSALTKAIDRQCRVQVRNGQSNPRNAYKKGFKRAVELASLSGDCADRKFTVATAFPPWQRVRSAYFRMQRERLRKTSLPNADIVKAERVDDCSSHESQDGCMKTELSTESAVSSVESASSRAPLYNSAKVTCKVVSDMSSTPDASTSSSNTASLTEHLLPTTDSHNDMRDLVINELTVSRAALSSSNVQHMQRCHSSSQSRGTPVEPSSESAFPSCSRLLKIDCQSETTCSNGTFRRHYLTRDPYTGRITVCKSATVQRTTKHSTSQRFPLRNSNSSHEILKKKTVFDETSPELTHLNNNEECVLVAPISFYEKKQSQFPELKSVARFKREARGNDSPAATGVLLKAANHSQRCDECNNIGNSVADCLREIEHVDVDIATQFKTELMEMMAKYRKSLLATCGTSHY
ncbi:hypothetical protein Tcan_15091 [Toxocara canis]|uniref:RYYR-CCHC domain-containing protein n=1 Tax=Toxocara canis TaxID=6265 RepID=A0A0B2W160_TOXCA|nr:hypothetical protein Tcan_15091 [Toxocara canis]